MKSCDNLRLDAEVAVRRKRFAGPATHADASLRKAIAGNHFPQAFAAGFRYLIRIPRKAAQGLRGSRISLHLARHLELRRTGPQLARAMVIGANRGR